MVDVLRGRLIRLAHERPEVRAGLVPILRRRAARGPEQVMLEVFLRELPNLPGIDRSDLEVDAETVMSSIQGAFHKKVKAAIERIEGKSKPGRRFKTKSKDKTWSDTDSGDTYYSYEVEYPDWVTWAVNVPMDPRKLLGDLRGEFRHLEVPPEVAEEGARAALSVMKAEEFLEEAAFEFTKRDMYLRKDKGFEKDLFDYVWDQAWEESAITEDGVEDEIHGAEPEKIDTNIRANRRVEPHPSKFGFRLEYEFRVAIEIRGW